MSTFFDYAKIWVKGGKGGDGMVAFYEKNIVQMEVQLEEMAVAEATSSSKLTKG